MQQARSIKTSQDCVNERPADTSMAGHKPKLLDNLREALRARHYSRCTEQTYCHWVKRFIFFHKVRHPAEMAEPEINAFLTLLPLICLRLVMISAPFRNFLATKTLAQR